MKVIALVSQKGGAGKTTLATGLAVSGERAGLSTVLVDLDPQASAAKWGDLRAAEIPVVTTAPATRIAPVLDAARAAGAALAILDTAPHSADAALAAARAAGLVLIPCRASTADLHAIAASVDLVRIAPRIQPSQRPDGPPRQFPTLHTLRVWPETSGAHEAVEGRTGHARELGDGGLGNAHLVASLT